MRSSAVALCCAAALLAAGCGGGEPADEPVVTAPGPDSPAGGDATEGDAGSDAARVGAVTVQGFRFEPSPLQLAIGSRVTWTNEDGVAHTATAGTPESPSGEFDVELAASGGSGSHVFDETGRFSYFCRIHPSMRGEVVVA